MEEQKIITGRKYYFIFYIIFLVGVIGHFTENLFNLMLLMTPYILFLMSIIALVISGEYKTRSVLLWLAVFYCITLLLEVTGVHTGMIFGEYNYGNVLGYKVAGVPFIIGINWVLLIAGAYCISNQFVTNKFLICIITGLLLVMFDFLLEPVAMKFGYWSWIDSIIPMQNYAAWFIISIIAALSLIHFNIKIQNKVFIHYYISMTLFFLILNFK